MNAPTQRRSRADGEYKALGGRPQHPARPLPVRPGPPVRQRPHVVLLLGDGHAWATIVAVLYTSPTPIARWKRRFDQGGVDEVFGRKRGRPRTCVHVWASLVVRWVLTMSPVSFGFARSQWSCAAVVLWEDFRES